MNLFSPPENIDTLPEIGNDNENILLPSRWKRLYAAVIDFGIALVSAIPLVLYKIYVLNMSWNSQGSMGFQAFVFAYGCIVFFLINGLLLMKSGQTIGKRIAHIKIATTYYFQPSLLTILLLRTYIPWLIWYLPDAGIIATAGILLIFINNKRCLHDYIANTVVVSANMKYNKIDT